MKNRTHRRGSARAEYIPASLQVILDSFAGCFTRPGLENFVALVSGWILCQGRHCVSRVIQVAGGPASAKHFATLYRFLSRGRWTGDDLSKAVFHLVLPLLPEGIEALVDDTLCKHGGPHLFGVAMHHDACRSTYSGGFGAARTVAFACGHNWVILALRVPLPWGEDKGIAIPILFRLYRGKKRCPVEQYRKRTELAAELVALLESWIPPGTRLFVAGDGEYASRTLVRGLAAETTFCGPMAMNAALYEPPPSYGGFGRPRKVGRRLSTPSQLAADPSIRWTKAKVSIYGRWVHLLVKTQTCLWYKVAGGRLVHLVVTRDPNGRLQDRAYFSTTANMPAEEILVRYSHRWLVEVSFRDAKQCLGIEDPQNGWRKRSGKRRAKKPGPQAVGLGGQCAVLHTVPLAFAAYAIVVVWYVRNCSSDDDVRRSRIRAPWYRQKVAPSFADMLIAMRREIWAGRLSATPASGRARAKVKRLLPDALLAA